MLHTVTALRHKRHLVLTYNSRLKDETRIRVRGLEEAGLIDVGFVEVHSYHAFCRKYYDNACSTDARILQVLEDDEVAEVTPLKPLLFDVIILDEVQDMTPTYYKLVHMAIRHAPKNIQIMLLGDVHQSIYGFAGSDPNYLTLANDRFADVGAGNGWVQKTISTSYRVPPSVANFVNILVKKPDFMRASKPTGLAINYIVCNTFDNNKKQPVIGELKRYLAEGYAPGDIFILAASIRKPFGASGTPITNLENRIVNDLKLSCYVPVSDDAEVDEREASGKIVFGSFHQTKGLEAKVVLVFGFDSSYFEYYARDADPFTCPNTLYVGVTRAKECLTLFHNNNKDFLPFLTRDEVVGSTSGLQIFDHFKGCGSFKGTGVDEGDDSRPKSVTNLLRGLSSITIRKALGRLKIVRECPEGPPVELQSVVKVADGLYEGVSILNGIAIPLAFEQMHRRRLTILDELREGDGAGALGKLAPWHRERINGLTIPLSIADLLYLANVYNAVSTGYISKLERIRFYDWLIEAELSRVMQIFEKNIKGCVKCEVPVESKGGRVSGRYDILDEDGVIWEIKCTKGALKDEHILQLAIYQEMGTGTGTGTGYKLLNALSGETVTVSLIDDNGPSVLDVCLARDTYESATVPSTADGADSTRIVNV